MKGLIIGEMPLDWCLGTFRPWATSRVATQLAVRPLAFYFASIHNLHSLRIKNSSATGQSRRFVANRSLNMRKRLPADPSRIDDVLPKSFFLSSSEALLAIDHGS